MEPDVDANVEPETPRLVTIQWLARAFHLSDNVTRKRMRGCKPVERKAGGFLYSFKEAAGYLADHQIDWREAIKTLKPTDLPPELNNAYWQALNRQTQFERESGQLWRTEEVFESMQAVAMLIRGVVLAWPDEVQSMLGITDEQREQLNAQVDSLLSEMRTEIKDQMASRRTPSLREHRVNEYDLELTTDPTRNEVKPVNLWDLY